MTLASLASAVLFAAVAIFLFSLALIVVFRSLPGDLWRKTVHENQLGPAILAAAITLALGWIIASAVH